MPLYYQDLEPLNEVPESHLFPDLADSDEKRGSELAARLRPLHPEARVFYMLSYTDNASVHYGVLDPGSHFLQKPLVPGTLIKKIWEVLDE